MASKYSGLQLGRAKQSPSLLGGVKPEDLVRHGSRGTSRLLHIYMVGLLFFWTGLGLRNACT